MPVVNRLVRDRAMRSQLDQPPGLKIAQAQSCNPGSQHQIPFPILIYGIGQTPTDD